MEIILPLELHNEQKFLDCASQIQYDEFSARKFVFYNGYSDLDIYENMGDDRIQTLLYGWEVCSLHWRDCITEEICHIVKVLAHHSLQLWFSQEWIVCSPCLKRMLLYYLQKAAPAFNQIADLREIDWTYLLHFQTTPWRVPYLQKMFAQLKQNKQTGIEPPVPAPTSEDFTFLQQEDLHLILLRLIKLFDAGSWEAVKQLSLRVLSAWLKTHANSRLEDLQRDQVYIILTAHTYLMTVFVADDNRGYIIDNMMYNIRFYTQSMQEARNSEGIIYTPARLIAQICVLLGLGKYGFFDHIMFKKFNLNLVTSFAVVLEAYSSYVMGNQLLDFMAMNDNDFKAHLPQFKLLMHRYVEEREHSERFLLNELTKLEAQRNSHATPNTVQLNLNHQQQICKGNRASNIGNYKNCDDDAKPQLDLDEEHDIQIDPVFQNVPLTDEVLEFVYNVLAPRDYHGWQFAKIVLLLKIIGHKLNTIEIWRYHPGLTTTFMLNLEHKLADNYADLAKLFSEIAFMEAEFWLTAFYLHPIRSYYGEVKRCSRIKKKRLHDDELSQPSPAKNRRLEPIPNIKFELLSSTIDVDEIVTITNHSAPVADYDPLYKALQALRLPRSIVNDLLTVAFQPRNKRYSWALEWETLHDRCSALLNSKDLKRKFVALNMAEANDKLKYLKIDYAKYKNRPQLDYGSIEEGYENAANIPETEVEHSPDEDAEEKKPRRHTRKYWDEVISEEEEEEASSDSDEYQEGTGRRTRTRAAAVVAKAMITDMEREIRSGHHSHALSPSSAALPEEETQPGSPETVPKDSLTQQEIAPEKRPFGELLQARDKFKNDTIGFKAFADIWSFEKNELSRVENDNNVLLESNTLLKKFRNLKCLKRDTSTATEKIETMPPLPEEHFSRPREAIRVETASDIFNLAGPSIPIEYPNEAESDNAMKMIKETIHSPSTSLLTDKVLNEEIEISITPPLREEINAVEADFETIIVKEPKEPRIETEMRSVIEESVEVKNSTGAIGTETAAAEKSVEVNMHAALSSETESETETARNENKMVLVEVISGEEPKDGPTIGEFQTDLYKTPEETAVVKANVLTRDEPEDDATIKEFQNELVDIVSAQIEVSAEKELAVKTTTFETKVDPLDAQELADRYETSTAEPLPKRLKAIPDDNVTPNTGITVNEEEDSEEQYNEQAVSFRSPTVPPSVEETESEEEASEMKKFRDRLIHECLTRPAKVHLVRLAPQDIETLRDFRVRVKRTDFENYYREQTQAQQQIKRRRRPSAKSRSNTEDSNASTPTLELKSVRKRYKKFVHITSDSPTSSPAMMLVRQRLKHFHHVTSDSSTEAEEISRPAPATVKRRRGAKLYTTPRSSSGLKIRISKKRADNAMADVIELSSGSSSSSLSSPVPSTSRGHFNQVAMPLEMDPLYEEEIVPYC
ncbi:uncharacterized protein LOC115632150 [Scaptodrosophila lebanonensis]|uniref:Uncharacterized protein LOC115632150 n=1 Tax=Drosophila lebanonensis TaxID=7225 RepID=A0A6J2UC69_DROLE|nr:uncharacterized protein LOC115632150 [Scaptodrosophila lebanonensis]